MSNKTCPRCGRSYPSSQKTCPYCAQRSRRRRPATPLEQIVEILRQNGERIFLTVTAVFLLVAVLGMLLTRCSDRPDPAPDPDQDTLQKEPADPVPETDPLVISNSTLSLYVGESAVLSVTGGPEDGVPEWTSSDEAVASYSEGIVTGVSAGSAVITVTSGEEKAVCNVTVKDKDPEVEVYLNRTDFTLSTKYPSFQMQVKIRDTRKTYEGGVIWSIEDPSVATVSETGLVERVGRGTTTLTATMGSKVLECIVRVS